MTRFARRCRFLVTVAFSSLTLTRRSDTAFEDDGNDPLYRQANNDMESANPMDPENAAAYSLSSIGIHDVHPSSATLYVAVVNTSGNLAVYNLITSERVYGCRSNLAFNPLLVSPDSSPSPPTRNATSAAVTELKFFVAGSNIGPAEMRSFYLIVRNSLNDVALYAGRKKPAASVVFAKCSMHVVVRPPKNAKQASPGLPNFERSKVRLREKEQYCAPPISYADNKISNATRFARRSSGRSRTSRGTQGFSPPSLGPSGLSTSAAAPTYCPRR